MNCFWRLMLHLGLRYVEHDNERWQPIIGRVIVKIRNNPKTSLAAVFGFVVVIFYLCNLVMNPYDGIPIRDQPDQTTKRPNDPIHKINDQSAPLSGSWTDVDILDPFNEFYRINISASKYVITWNSPDVPINNAKPRKSTFHRSHHFDGSYSDMFREYAHPAAVKRTETEGIIPKTLMILFGDSHERGVLSLWNATDTSGHSNCQKAIAQQYCCDVEDAAHGINVTFCNVFGFGVKVESGENYNAFMKSMAQTSALEDASYQRRIESSLMKWKEMYGVDVSKECQSGRWQCHVMFQSALWDVMRRHQDLKKVHEYKQNLWDLFQFIKNDAFPFVGNNLIWRTSPIPIWWGPTKHQESDGWVTAVHTTNRIGLNLFESQRQQGRMRVLHWANFVPVASKEMDTHHWNGKYHNLYVGLLYRYTTLPPQ